MFVFRNIWHTSFSWNTSSDYTLSKVSVIGPSMFGHTIWLLNHCFDPIFHWLYFLYILWILDLYSAFFYILYHLIVVSFDFTLFWYFFSFLLITTTFSLTNLFYLLLPHTFSLVFIDFTLFNFFLLFHFIDAFFFVIRFFSFTSFWTLFLWFYSLTVFLWFSCYSVDSTILGGISGCIYALRLLFSFDYIFRRLPSLYISTPYTSRYTKSGRSSTFSQNAAANQKLYWHCSFKDPCICFISSSDTTFPSSTLSTTTSLQFPQLSLNFNSAVSPKHWASRMEYNSLKFILFDSHHCLVHREFHSLINL